MIEAFWIKVHDVAFAVQLGAVVVNIVIGSYYIRRVRRTALIHANLRIILCNLVAQYYVLEVGRIGEYLNEWFASKPRVVTNVICIFCKFFYDLGAVAVALSILLIASERFAATILTRSYERKPATVGWAVTIAAYSLGGIFSLATTFYDIVLTLDFDIRTYQGSCLLEARHPVLYTSMWALGASTCAIGSVDSSKKAKGITKMFLLMLLQLYRYNRSKRQRSSCAALHVRYQYSENIATLRAIVPAIAVYGVVALVGLALSVHMLALQKVHRETRPNDVDWQSDVILHILHIIAESYVGCTVLFSMTRFEPLRVRVRKDMRCILPATDELLCDDESKYTWKPSVMTETYFRMLEKTWDIALDERK